ncbi:hypothetical protein KQI63_14255 [bacterium]|nr:hypothetical protein [bacterium]
MKRSLILVVSICLTSVLMIACRSSSPGNGNTPIGPSDTTETRSPNPSRQPGDPILPDPDWADYYASHWDSTGLGPDDLSCDYRQMLDSYDPYEYLLRWVYQRTRSGAEDTVDYVHKLVERDSDDYSKQLIVRQSNSLADVRHGQLIATIWHSHQDYSVHDYFIIDGYYHDIMHWPFYCFCAAQAGDTIRYRQHVVEGESVRKELVQVIGWDETVHLPDTTFTGCYGVVIDTLVSDSTQDYHRQVFNYYAPGIGLVKQVDILNSDQDSHTTTVEYKPPVSMPWYYPIPTGPGEPGEAIQEFYPFAEGRQWEYRQTGGWQDSLFIRDECGAPSSGEQGYAHFPVQEFQASWGDTSGIMEEPVISFWGTYNGNDVLKCNTPNTTYKAMPQFFRFPNVEPGQLLFDSSRVGSYYESARVVSVNSTVEVEAGTFENVYVVHYHQASGSGQWRSSITGDEYYAPNVGLILAEWETSFDYQDWNVRQELLSWEPGN